MLLKKETRSDVRLDSSECEIRNYLGWCKQALLIINTVYYIIKSYVLLQIGKLDDTENGHTFYSYSLSRRGR